MIASYPNAYLADAATFDDVMQLSETEFYQAETLLNAYTAGMTLAVFQRMGLFRAATDGYTPDALKAAIGLAPEHSRLLDALLDILERSQYLTRTADRYVATALVDTADTQQQLRNYRDHQQETLYMSAAAWAFIEATVRLEAICFEAMPDMLAGRRTYLDVMFPNGDLTLVAAIYKGTIQQYLNGRVASRVRELVEEKLALYGSVTLLEVGAGTGGTTALIFKELESLNPNALTYWYTDISAGFTRVGKREFGARYPFVQYKPLDINRPVDAQGFVPGSVDIVICNNVLHATPSMAGALTHTSQLLRDGGHVVVNDLTQRLDFNTVTFGFTREWWNFTDPEWRIPHAPVLTNRAWRKLLAEYNYTHVTVEGVPGMPEEKLHQSLIVAQLSQP
ncbi:MULTISPECIES: class I SAM-dependent methyltransferase [Spirosoma]|uniref:Methyltransferase n=1 Tax=Spirosoma sordidisoli TaxID=2502893 RepID=A0A4Q2UIQ7_9BACT|nr:MULTISPECIES: class I SAM-dependent methyltransferase [Spirosoma]RYC68462.1 methyltransferase [Spirosoma sordidisoli]